MLEKFSSYEFSLTTLTSGCLQSERPHIVCERRASGERRVRTRRAGAARFWRCRVAGGAPASACAAPYRAHHDQAGSN